MIERYSHKNMAFILIEVQTKRGFLRPLFSISLSRLSLLLVADIGQGTHPCTFGVCFDDQDSGGFHKKDYRSVPRRKGFGEEKRRMLLCFLSLICVVERKERKEVAKNRLLCFDWGCRTRAQFIIAPRLLVVYPDPFHFPWVLHFALSHTMENL